MAIINTLLTARDNTTAVVKKVADNIKKSSDDISKSLEKASDSSATFENSFDKLRNIDMTSLSGVIDIVKEIQDQMNTATTDTQKFLMKMGLLAGGAAALSYGVLTAVNASAEYVNTMNEAAIASGTTIERLQQMQAIFRSTGIDVQKFGDINKDVLDHLGDAFRDGSGPAEDMKAYGLNLQDFNKYLNATNGGIDAVIHAFYEMQKAGKSNAEITNMMETLASDSSHLVTTLKQYGTEQEALNAINGAHAGITAELAEKYKDYEIKVKQLETAFMNFQANALAPTVDEITNLLDVMNGDFDGSKLSQWLKSFYYGGDNIVSQAIRAMDGVDARFVNGTAENRAARDSNNYPPVNTDAAAPEGGWVNKEKEDAARKAAQKAAEAAAARFKTQQEQAAKWLNQLDINNASEIKKAEITYDTQIKQLDEFLRKKLISQQQYNHGVEAANSALSAAQREESERQETANAESRKTQGIISENDYQQRILDIKYKYLMQGLDAAYYTEMEALNAKHEAGKLAEEQYQQDLQGIKSKYEFDKKQATGNYKANTATQEYKAQADELERYSSVMSGVSNVASQMGSLIASSAEEGSAAWVAATAVTKAAAIANAIISAELAAAQVMASPASLTLAQKISEAGIVRAMGYASASIIAAQGIAEIAGAREKGGQVMAGSTYLVGEKGPELFTAGATGNITSNKDLNSGGGSAVFNQTNNFYQSGLKQDDLDMIKTTTEGLIDHKLNAEKRVKGKLAAIG